MRNLKPRLFSHGPLLPVFCPRFFNIFGTERIEAVALGANPTLSLPFPTESLMTGR